MKNLKNGIDTCSENSGLCKRCITNCIKYSNRVYIMLCFGCTNFGTTGVKSETKDSEFIKTLHALCAEI